MELKEAFLSHLRLVADEIELGDHLLVILIGHGHEVNFGIFVGHGEQTVSTAEVQSAVSNCSFTTDVALLLTSCYSGGWILDKALPALTPAAATPKLESDSTNRCRSRRYGGGLFAAAIAKTLVENAAVATSDTATYQNFTDQVAQNMRKLWRLGSPPAFSAAKDALWGVPTGAVTGIHLGDQYASRFAGLPDYPANPDTGASDRQTGSRTKAALESKMAQYMGMKPGWDTAGGE